MKNPTLIVTAIFTVFATGTLAGSSNHIPLANRIEALEHQVDLLWIQIAELNRKLNDKTDKIKGVELKWNLDNEPFICSPASELVYPLAVPYTDITNHDH